jgi:Protein of unknown function (DUF2863)
MKRTRNKAPQRITRDTERLISSAASAVLSGGLAEDQFWFREIGAQLATLLERGNDAAIESALDQTFQTNQPAHEMLAQWTEAVSESFILEMNETRYHALLVAIPMIAWSKYPIAWGALPNAKVAPIYAHLCAHIAAGGAKVHLNPFLYAIDHLPRGFSDTRKLTQKMAEAAITGKAAIDYKRLGDSVDMPADIRFLLACIVVKEGLPHFRWQEPAVKGNAYQSRRDCLSDWVAQCRPCLAELIPGAAFECGLPDAYFRNCRDADHRVRPYTLTSTISELESLINLKAGDISTIIAGVGETQVDEYRVSFTRRGDDDIYHGVVWPLFGPEDDEMNPSPRHQIEEVLRQSGVTEIQALSGVLPPEFCEDCGAPLFYNKDGEAVHAEMPEEGDRPSVHYH